MTCPLCHRPLILRKGKHGAFMGCSGYPACTFTKNTESATEAKNKAMDAITNSFLFKHGFNKKGERA